METKTPIIAENPCPGKIRVGTISYSKGQKIYPQTPPGYTRIEVMTKSTAYGSIGPYVLANSKGQIMENIWQFSKVYKKVPAVTCKYSKYDSTITWQHPAEVHVVNEIRTKEYDAWRKKGFNNKYFVRYPVGFDPKMRASCLYSFRDENPEEKLTYVQARKLIYYPVYAELVRKRKKYKNLLSRLANGENLFIIEVDGPRQESLNYYIKKYKVLPTFIEHNSILVTQKNMHIMLNDAKHAFGHGYCLAIALLEDVGKIDATSLMFQD